jgi:hypothetical protein
MAYNMRNLFCTNLPKRDPVSEDSGKQFSAPISKDTLWKLFNHGGVSSGGCEEEANEEEPVTYYNSFSSKLNLFNLFNTGLPARDNYELSCSESEGSVDAEYSRIYCQDCSPSQEPEDEEDR